MENQSNKPGSAKISIEQALASAAAALPKYIERYFSLKEAQLSAQREKQTMDHQLEKYKTELRQANGTI